MKTAKLHAGPELPSLTVCDRIRALIEICEPTGDADWRETDNSFPNKACS